MRHFLTVSQRLARHAPNPMSGNEYEFSGRYSRSENFVGLNGCRCGGRGGPVEAVNRIGAVTFAPSSLGLQRQMGPRRPL